MPTISEHDALPAGTRLSEFEIQQVLGIGGFGVVYLAFDHALERQVAIKEYMPSALASRGEGEEVVLRSAAHVETFELGLRSFINEARLLARFDHPSLVKVYRFWEAHGTAYMVMPYYRGQTLQQVRREMSAPPDEAWLRRLLNPLLGALECLHRENVFHRDVAPDNILLLDDESGPAQGRPVLLDLGAARHVIGDHTHALTAIVKPSFAPIEQYAETVQLRQGPWTDLYALAAVIHFCITGRPPMPATVRAVQDDLPSLQAMRAGLASGFDRPLSESFVVAIDHALMVRPQDRPESVAVWREELSGVVGGQGADEALPEHEPGWIAQTVLLRKAGAPEPPGHQAVQAQAFLTTIPAAGQLSAAPAWPGAGPPAQASASADAGGLQGALASSASSGRPDSLDRHDMPPMPVTVPLGTSRQAGDAGDEPRGWAPASAPESEALPYLSHWLRWVFVALLVALVGALWWSRHQAARPVPAAEPALASPAAVAPAPSVAPVAQQPGNIGSQAGQVTDAKSRREARQPAKEQAAARPDEEPNQPLSPRKACSGKSFILLAICMKRHCVRPEYAAHPECERMRQQEASQRSNYP
jgi:hypothetical protein